MDAVRVLEQDHHEIEMLFDQYERAGVEEQPRLIERVCFQLEAHTRAEEETFYPAVRSALGQDGVELVEEALAEHTRVARLIQEIRAFRPGDELMERKFAVLMDEVRYHVDEEESEMFPLVRANMEPQLGLLGEALEQRHQISGIVSYQ
ncbi:MAG TPA: hemerythrin domain-containing protein [Chloroflexota bacterium]|nr:hemerythrin domain-containing protein [Chloroflexota bacterium]